MWRTLKTDVIEGADGTIRRHRPYLVLEARDRPARSALDDCLRPLDYHRYPRVFASTPTYIYCPSRAALLACRARRSPLEFGGIEARWAKSTWYQKDTTDTPHRAAPRPHSGHSSRAAPDDFTTTKDSGCRGIRQAHRPRRRRCRRWNDPCAKWAEQRGAPGASVTTTGTPAAKASTGAMPNGSASVGIANALALRKRSMISALDRDPTSLTGMPLRPSFERSRSGPRRRP